ncbi:cell division protein FtsH, partial [Deinococcus hohokamensis]
MLRRRLAPVVLTLLLSAVSGTGQAAGVPTSGGPPSSLPGPAAGLSGPVDTPGPYTINRLFEDLRAGRVQGMTLDGAGNASVTLHSSLRPQSLVVPPDAATLARIRAAGVPLRVLSGASPLGWVAQALPLLLTALILLVLWRSMRGPGTANSSAQFGKTRAAVVMEGQVKVTFADVAGCDEA